MNSTTEYQLLSEIRSLALGADERELRSKRESLMGNPEKVKSLCLVAGIRPTGSVAALVRKLVTLGQRFADTMA